MQSVDLSNRIARLNHEIDAAYESGILQGIEDKEQELEALLETAENQEGEIEVESANHDDSWPDAATELARMKLRWDSGAILPCPGQTFAQFAREAFAAEGPHQIQPEVTDDLIEAAAEEVLQYWRKLQERRNRLRPQPTN